MLERFTYNQKTWGLIISAVLLTIVGYYLAISPTFELQHKINKAEVEIEKAKTASSDVKKATKELAKLEQMVGQTSASFEIFQKELLNAVVPFADENHIKVTEIKLPHLAQKNTYEVQTLQIVCKGNFEQLSRLLDHIQRNNIGRVCSVNYELKKDYKLKKRFLYATFYIQNYIAL